MLHDLRVLDCTQRLGWLTGRILADLGADVVKLEKPGFDADEPVWRAFNVNKRVIKLDVDTTDDRGNLTELLRHADVLIETSPPGESPLAECLAPIRVAALNNRLVHVSITPFGRTGPRAHWEGSDLEIMAAGGAMSLAGERDGKPLRISEPQSPGWAGAFAAVGALTAIIDRDRTGLGQHVDVSAQAAVVAALSHAPTFYDLLGDVPRGSGAFITGRTVTGARFRAIWPCRDGYVNFVLYGGKAGTRTNEQLVKWMRQRGFDPGPLAAIDWAQFDLKQATQDEVDSLEAPIGQFLAGLTKAEFRDGAAAREMLGYPVTTVADIAADPQLDARNFWCDIRGREGAAERYCGAFAVVDGVRPSLRYAAGEAVAFAALLADWGVAGAASVREAAS